MEVAAAAAADDRHPNASLTALPNLLTLTRPLFGGAIWLVRGRAWAMFGLMSAAGLTDVLDGWIARRRARRAGRTVDGTPGVWLDPLCDKIFVVTALGALLSQAPSSWPWLTLVMTREVLLAVLLLAHRLIPARRRKRRFQFRTAAIGKVTTVAQFAAVSAFVFGLHVAPAIAVVAGVTGLAAVVHYALRRPVATSPSVSAT